MIITNRMAGRFLCFCFGILLPWGLQAQEAEPFAAEKASIREIKLSGDYYYTDVSSENEEDARIMALKLLALEIQGQETGCEGVESLLQDSCRYIRLKRIDRPRVFAYIAKETVAVWLSGGTIPPPQVPEGETVVTPDTSGRIPADNRDTILRSDTLVLRPDTVEVRLQSDTSALRPVADTLSVPKDTVRDTTAEKALATADTLTTTIRDTVTAVVTDTVKVVVRDTVKLTVTDTVRTRLELRTTGNDRLDRILSMKTIAEVQPFFIAEKKEGRMMFGKMSSALRPEECYLLFFNREGKVIAVLGKGSGSRLNLLTGQNDSADRYREGNRVIWFLLYE